MVLATPNRWAIFAVTVAAAMEARPAMAEFSPIIVEEMPRFSMMMLSSGKPRPICDTNSRDGGNGSDQRWPVYFLNRRRRAGRRL